MKIFARAQPFSPVLAKTVARDRSGAGGNMVDFPMSKSRTFVSVEGCGGKANLEGAGCCS